MAKQKKYISGQITGLSHDEYTHLFGLAEAKLIDMGFEPVNPLKVLACDTEDCGPKDSVKPDGSYLHAYWCYMKYDIKAMLECQGTVMLQNWQNSNGAKKEREISILCGLEISYFTMDWELI